MAKEFAAQGHDVTIICRRHPENNAPTTRDGVRIVPAIELKGTKSIRLNLIKDFYYAMRVLFMLPRADILVTNTFWLPVLAGMFRRGAGRIDVHVARVPKGQMGLYIKSGATRITGVSSAICKWIVEQTPEAAARTRVIINSIDTANFRPPATPRNFASGEQVIVYTGRIHPEKGISILIAAFKLLAARHPNVRLEIYGPYKIEDGGGGEAFRNELLRQAEGLPVKFNEPIYDRGKLADALRAAHYFCYPSVAEKGEACPIAPLEAMATGLVTIVSDLPQFDDYLKHGESGIKFDHRGDEAPARLAEEFSRLIGQPELALALSANAAESAGKFTNAYIAGQYLDDFKEMLAE